MTHTSGPWAFDGARVYSPAADEKVMVMRADGTAVESGGGIIALVYAPVRAPRQERLANADLITAAPLMLKALHDVWVLAETLDIGNRERAMFREAVGAVLDQAEGRTPAAPPLSGQPCGCDPAAGWKRRWVVLTAW